LPAFEAKKLKADSGETIVQLKFEADAPKKQNMLLLKYISHKV
jgi:hypothetical protein